MKKKQRDPERERRKNSGGYVIFFLQEIHLFDVIFAYILKMDVGDVRIQLIFIDTLTCALDI